MAMLPEGPAAPGTRRFLGLFELAPGVGGGHAAAALYAAFISIGMLNFMLFARPFLLFEVIGVPQAQIGRISGFISTGIEVLSLALVLAVGTWADRVGRRLFYALGLALLGAGYVGMIFVESLAAFALNLTVMGLGSAMIGTMLGLVMVDYPAEASRGKWAGLTAIMNGLGIMLVSLGITKVPGWLEHRGMADTLAMQWTLAGMAAWCFVSAAILRYGMITGLRAGASVRASEPMLAMLRDGIGAARREPRILLCYLCFLVSRADLVVVASYLTLWAQDVGRAQGLAPTEYIARSGLLFAVTQGMALVWGPVCGVLLDRLDRVCCVVLSLALAGCAYILLGSLADPLSATAFGVAAVVGMGQISVLLATQSLIGQEAPVERRGTIMGIATFFGTVGLLVSLAAGGVLYDTWKPSAPLVVFGLLNLLVLVAAVRIWRRAGGAVRRQRLLATSP